MPPARPKPPASSPDTCKRAAKPQLLDIFEAHRYFGAALSGGLERRSPSARWIAYHRGVGPRDMTLRISDDVVFRDLAGEAVLLHVGTGTYFGLDSVGTRMWHLLAEHGSPEKVVETMLTEYTIEEDGLRRDVDRLIGQLMEKGLLTADAAETSTPG